MYFVRYLIKYIRLCYLTLLNMHQNLKRKTDLRFEPTKSIKVYLMSIYGLKSITMLIY